MRNIIFTLFLLLSLFLTPHSNGFYGARQKNLFESVTTIVSAAGVTNIATNVNSHHVVTGALAQEVRLPLLTTVANGREFSVFNDSSGTTTVKDSTGAVTIAILVNGQGATVRVTNSGTGTFSTAFTSDIAPDTGIGDFLADGSVPMTGPIKFTQNTQDFQIIVADPTTGFNDFVIKNNSADLGTQFIIKPEATDGTDKMFALLEIQPINVEAFVYAGFDSVLDVYLFYSRQTGTGAHKPIRMGHFTGTFASVDSIILQIDGSVEIAGGPLLLSEYIATEEQLVAMTADDQSVTATRSMMRVTSDNATSTLRTMDLQNGTTDGQRLTIISDTPTNAWELQNTGNQCLTALFTSTDNAALSLIWNSTTACWHEPR